VKGKSSVLRAVSSSLVSVSADIISRSFDEQGNDTLCALCIALTDVVFFSARL
jgi:hypothetical protein